MLILNIYCFPIVFRPALELWDSLLFSSLQHWACQGEAKQKGFGIEKFQPNIKASREQCVFSAPQQRFIEPAGETSRRTWASAPPFHRPASCCQGQECGAYRGDRWIEEASKGIPRRKGSFKISFECEAGGNTIQPTIQTLCFYMHTREAWFGREVAFSHFTLSKEQILCCCKCAYWIFRKVCLFGFVGQEYARWSSVGGDICASMMFGSWFQLSAYFSMLRR